MSIHYTHPYLITPAHKISVDLVGVGGTGSQTLTNLARMNEALIGLRHPGLQVRAWDADTVSQSNLGRQLFCQSDLGSNKATVLITRINRFFGTEWEAMPCIYTGINQSNITITCVDSAAARIKIGEKLQDSNVKIKTNHPTDKAYYWLDMGNLQKTGQVILGTIGRISQRMSDQPTKESLPTVLKKFPQIRKIKEKNQGPSCSLAEALDKQDLFINSAMAQFGVGLLWKLIREQYISIQGCFVNLDTFSVNPIKIV